MVKLSRRIKQTALGIAGALALTAGGLLYSHVSQTPANKALSTFPLKIPGAEKVEKQKVRGANKTLVHILQAHGARDVTKNERAYVIVTQKEIYRILDSLIYNEGIRDVYNEGNWAGMMEYLVNHPEQVDLTNIRPTIDEKYFSGAENILQEEGRLRLVPAETQEGNFVAQDAVRDYKNGEITLEELDKLVSDSREDIALDIVSKSDLPLNVIIYGGAHNFGDNIERWNAEHPDKKYSLIEVTPRGYRSLE